MRLLLQPNRKSLELLLTAWVRWTVGGGYVTRVTSYPGVIFRHPFEGRCGRVTGRTCNFGPDRSVVA